MLLTNEADLSSFLNINRPMQQVLKPLLHQLLPLELINDLILKPKTTPITESGGSESFSAVLLVKLTNFLFFLLFKKESTQMV